GIRDRTVTGVQTCALPICPRIPLAEVVFANTYKVYSTVSGRRFVSDLRDAQAKGYISKTPHYTSLSRYLENPTLTPFLKLLIEEIGRASCRERVYMWVVTV